MKSRIIMLRELAAASTSFGLSLRRNRREHLFIATRIYGVSWLVQWPTALALSVAGWLFFFGVFDYALHLPFPRGAIFEWLPGGVVGNLLASISR
jgi:hypothetical protein